MLIGHHMFSLEKCLFKAFAFLKVELLYFCCWFLGDLCIIWILISSYIWFANIFSHSVICLFTLLILSLDIQNFFLFFFFLIFLFSWNFQFFPFFLSLPLFLLSHPRNHWHIMSWKFALCFLPTFLYFKSCLHLSRSLIHFYLILICDIR